MFGGDDRDVFLQGDRAHVNGDVVDGGTGGDDFDTLDLTGSGPFLLTNLSVDADGDSQSGRVELLNEKGKIVGAFEFREIEKIVPCFTSGMAMVASICSTLRAEI